MTVALVYDRINKWGGAERVLLSLHKIFPDAPLFTSVYNKEKAPWAKVFDIRTSFLQNFPLASSSHEFYATLMPIAFETFSFDEYDLVISVTSEAAKGIITKPKTLHICYCLTPTRYLWSGYEDYFENRFLYFLSKPFIYYLRKWDKIVAQRPDAYIAISKEVQNRIKEYYGRESEVIYPPVELVQNLILAGPAARSSQGAPASLADAANAGALLGIPPLASPANNPSTFATPRKGEDYFLIVSRLVPYKRIDIAIKACNKLKLPLKIIGVGSQMENLKKMAGPTIEFLGNLTDEQLVSYYRGCRALLFPGKEDLGLTILEAQSFGRPVIGYKDGGALETIIDGKTGSFFYPQTVKALLEKLEKFNQLRFDSKECVEQAKKFSQDRFEKELKEIIAKEIKRNIT